LLAFLKKFNVNKGYIISSKKEEKQKINGKTIQVVPAFKFLLKYEEKGKPDFGGCGGGVFEKVIK